METQHTNGEWKYISSHKNIASEGPRVISDACPIAEFGFQSDVLTKTEREANARLISAAPDMLETLVKISKCNRTEGLPVDVVISMMEAIEKATGQA